MRTVLCGFADEVSITPVDLHYNSLSKECLDRCRDDFYKSLLRFDTSLQRWETGFESVPFVGRAYHAATVLGSKIWVTGGSSAKTVFSDIWVFDTLTLGWKEVTLR